MSPSVIAVATLAGLLPLTLSLLALRRRADPRPTPADRVTLVRSVGAGGCAFVTTLALLGAAPERSWTLVAIAMPTLALDAVDGWVARHTNSATAAGARFDAELDAGVVLILSIALAPTLGPWVLLIGLARYWYAAIAWWWPWLEAPLPPSRARKAVAALQGIALTVALAPATAFPVAVVVVAAAGTLLAWSFASQARQAWRSVGGASG
jgi:phosphatidylglycerophosphate synthase